MTHPRLTQTEIAANRRLMIKAWVLTALSPDEIAGFLAAEMPPTITELITFARKRTANIAAKCAHCGKSVLIEPPQVGQKAEKSAAEQKPFTATRARARSNT